MAGDLTCLRCRQPITSGAPACLHCGGPLTWGTRRGPDPMVGKKRWHRMQWALLDYYGALLGPYGVTLYLALCRYMDATTRTCFPSYATLATLTGMSERKAIQTARQLETLGLITITRRPHTSNIFTIHILIDPQDTA